MLILPPFARRESSLSSFKYDWNNKKKLWHLFMCAHLSFSCAHRYIFLLFILFISWHSECYQSAMLFIFVLDSSLFLYYFFHREFLLNLVWLRVYRSSTILCRRRRLVRRNRVLFFIKHSKLYFVIFFIYFLLFFLHCVINHAHVGCKMAADDRFNAMLFL